MPELNDIIQQALRARHKLLAIYLTCGYPTLEWTLPLARAAFEAGADLIELGLPFSDPLADGPTIQHASTIALRNGFQMRHAFDTARTLGNFGPTLLMGYSNSVLARGAESFLNECRECRVKGLVIPDLPIDEEQAVWQRFKATGIPIIPFVSPTTSSGRAAIIDELNAPFIYAVSIAGVTGARHSLSRDVEEYLARMKAQLQTPILVGFGVSSPETAAQLAAIADGVIVGSAVIQCIEQAASLAEAVTKVSAFIKGIRAAIDQVSKQAVLSC